MSKTPTMQTCKHERVLTFHCEVDGNPAPLWACPECDLKFVPITNELRLERERDEALDALRKVLPYMRVDTPNACEAFDTARAILDKVKE